MPCRFSFPTAVPEPVLEVLGEDLHVFPGQDVLDEGRGDSQVDQGLVDPFPQAVLLGLAVRQVQLADELLELLEHEGVETVVVFGDDFLLIVGVFLFRHGYVLSWVIRCSLPVVSDATALPRNGSDHAAFYRSSWGGSIGAMSGAWFLLALWGGEAIVIADCQSMVVGRGRWEGQERVLTALRSGLCPAGTDEHRAYVPGPAGRKPCCTDEWMP
jgi:hypothetical protein